MRASYKKVIFATVCCINSSVFAQSTDSAFVFLENQFDKQWNPNALQVISGSGANSNSINTVMFSDVLLRSSFTPDAKQRFLDKEANNTNLYFGYGVSGEYKLDSAWGVYAKHKQESYFSLDNELSKLLLFGNARFAGKSISSQDSRVLLYTASTLGATHKTISTDKWLVKTSIGVSTLYDYTTYTAKNIDLFTAQDGAYIDVAVENGVWINQEISKPGYGLDFGVDAYFTPNLQNEVVLRLSDVSAYFIPSGRMKTVDSSFRFEGIHYNLNSDSSDFSFSTDSVFGDIRNREGQENKMTWLPSNLSLHWIRTLKNQNKIGVQAHTTSLGKLGNYTAVYYTQSLKSNCKLKSTIGYGNFTGFQWNEAVEFSLRTSNIFVSAIGLNALLSPRISHSYGVIFGVSKRF